MDKNKDINTAFSIMMANLSIAVMDKPISEIENLIKTGIQQLAKELKATSLYLYYKNTNDTGFESKYLWTEADGFSDFPDLIIYDDFPLASSDVNAGKSIFCNSFRSTDDKLIEEIAKWKKTEKFDVACFSFKSRGRVRGFIGIDRIEESYSLSENEINLISTFSNLIVAVNNRINKDETIEILMREFSVMQEMSQIANEATSILELMSGIIRIVGRILKPDSFGIGIINLTAKEFEMTGWYLKDNLEIGMRPFSNKDGVVYQSVNTKKAIRHGDILLTDKFVATYEGIRSELCVPIIYQDKVVGVINVESKQLNAYSSLDEKLLILLANQLATANSKIELFDEINQLAVIDPLTNIANRRKFFSFSEIEFAAAKRYNRKLSMVMIDIDHFKKINDQFGHGVGDVVLKSLAETISNSLRETDLVARLGGDEFVVILSETGIDEAGKLSQRIFDEIILQEVGFTAGLVKYQVSMGIATLDAEINSIDMLLERADKALLFSKSKEKRGISIWDEII